MSNGSSSVAECGHLFTKETMINGVPKLIKCVEIAGQIFTTSEGPVSIIRLEDEWYEDVESPQEVIQALKANSRLRADLFTFWQRLPDSKPHYTYHMEWDSIGAMPVISYEHWWQNQIRTNTRGHIRKAKKSGVIVKETMFTDDFIRGMVEIFNESSIRQGRPFWHYGKDFETVKSQFSRSLFREQLFGAYYENQLIGFIFLGHSGKYAVLGQIISRLNHRDKGTNNALVSKAVEICADQKIPYLVYANWPPPGSLADFQRQNGFEKIDLPRYYVPLNWRGKLALKYGLHRGWKEMLPGHLRQSLKRIKANWYTYYGNRTN